MRNKARPGPGQKTKIDSPIKKKKLKTKNGSGVNIHKIIINKPFSDLDTNKLDKIIRGFEMSEESEDQEITQDGATDEIPEVVAPVSEEQPENPEVEVSTEDKILAVMQKMTDKQDTFEKEIQKMKMSAEERVAQEALDKAVEEKLIAKNAEMEEMKVKFAELEKKQAIQDEVQKQLGKLSPIKQSLSADAPDENGDDKYNNLMPGIDKSKQQAYKDTAKILQSYASPMDED